MSSRGTNQTIIALLNDNRTKLSSVRSVFKTAMANNDDSRMTALLDKHDDALRGTTDEGARIKAEMEGNSRLVKEACTILQRIVAKTYPRERLEGDLRRTLGRTGEALAATHARCQERFDALLQAEDRLSGFTSPGTELPAFLEPRATGLGRVRPGIPMAPIKQWSDEIDAEIKREEAAKARRRRERVKAEEEERQSELRKAETARKAKEAKLAKLQHERLSEQLASARHARQQAREEMKREAADKEARQRKAEQDAFERHRRNLHAVVEKHRAERAVEEEAREAAHADSGPRPKTALERFEETQALAERHRADIDRVARHRRRVRAQQREAMAPGRRAEAMAMAEAAKVEARVAADPTRLTRPTTAHFRRVAASIIGEGYREGADTPEKVTTGFDFIKQGNLSGRGTPGWRVGL